VGAVRPSMLDAAWAVAQVVLHNRRRVEEESLQDLEAAPSLGVVEGQSWLHPMVGAMNSGMVEGSSAARRTRLDCRCILHALRRC